MNIGKTNDWSGRPLSYIPHGLVTWIAKFHVLQIIISIPILQVSLYCVHPRNVLCNENIIMQQLTSITAISTLVYDRTEHSA